VVLGSRKQTAAAGRDNLPDAVTIPTDDEFFVPAAMDESQYVYQQQSSRGATAGNQYEAPMPIDHLTSRRVSYAEPSEPDMSSMPSYAYAIAPPGGRLQETRLSEGPTVDQDGRIGASMYLEDVEAMYARPFPAAGQRSVFAGKAVTGPNGMYATVADMEASADAMYAAAASTEYVFAAAPEAPPLYAATRTAGPERRPTAFAPPRGPHSHGLSHGYEASVPANGFGLRLGADPELVAGAKEEQV